MLKGETRLPCPRCGKADLRFYFHAFQRDRGTGTFWVWCPACGTTSHLPRVKPAGDMPKDPFQDLGLEDFARLELDPDEPLLDRLDRLWDQGDLKSSS